MLEAGCGGILFPLNLNIKQTIYLYENKLFKNVV